MLKKFKTDKKKLLLLLLLLLSIPLAQQVYAQTAEEAAAATNLLAYIQPVMNYFWGLITQLLTGLVYLIFSAFLLQTAVNNSATWIDIHSDFVKIGLNFTTALADVLLIAVFIAIAIGYVFKIEGYNNQKVIIKFFISALLIHFAPLFVGMITDIANIIVKGIMIGKEDLFTSVFIWDLGPEVLFSIIALGLTFTGAALLSMAGIVGTVANYGTLVLAFGNLFLGVPKYILQAMIVNIIAGLVFATAMFFLTRVFVIQILTILSPLAILSGAIEPTKRYFEMWKSWIIKWSFGGILYLFLMVLGLTALDMLGTLSNGADASLSLGDRIITIGMGWNFKWVALAIYMMTVDTLCLTLIPELSGTFTSKIKEGVGKSKGSATGADKKIRGKAFDTATESWGMGTAESRKTALKSK